MGRPWVRFAAAFLTALLLSSSGRAQNPPSSTPATPIVRSVAVSGAHQLGDAESIDAMQARVGQPLPDTPDHLAERIERRYRGEGYTFAKAVVTFDETAGSLSVAIDEGVVDAVEFQGIPERLARQVAEDFAVRGGDVFNRRRALDALTAALLPTRGAITTARVSTTDPETGEPRRRTFAMIERDGQHVLIVALRERDGRFRVAPDFGDREDWFTPVDGLVPSLGFGAVAFDHERFNHTFVAGHVSLKLATKNVGWALGFERPLFSTRKLYVGGELRDLTASDDTWQVTSTEASVDAIGARKSFRDYYARRGVQATAAWRVHPHVEVLGAWRTEHERPLAVQSDFSIFNRDDLFRPNLPAADGRLNAVIVGATIDSTGFGRESLEATYRRHQLDSMFGEALPYPERNEFAPMWRVDWTSEISTPGTLSSDFDFRRHIVSARLRKTVAPHQDVAVRAIGGWSDGTLPPQRQFSVGGIGSVHGYAFKEQVGDTLALFNAEYSIGWRDGARAIGFFDVGRATAPSAVTAATRPWLRGVGFGFAVGRNDDLRIDFGYRADGVPSSLQVLVRFGRGF